MFEALGLVAAIVELLFLALYTCLSKTSGNKIVGFCTTFLTLGTGNGLRYIESFNCKLSCGYSTNNHNRFLCIHNFHILDIVQVDA